MRHRRKFETRGRHRMLPAEKKWINTCVCCQKSGYDPGLPEVLTIRAYGKSDHPTHTAAHLRYFYPPMALDENGICDECRKAMEKK